MNRKVSATIYVLLSVVIVVLAVGVVIYLYTDKAQEQTPEQTPEQFICSQIQQAPAWITPNGKLLGYGFNLFDVNKLMADKVFFVYYPDCEPCQQQINYFGETWKEYEDSGLTIDCGAQ